MVEQICNKLANLSSAEIIRLRNILLRKSDHYNNLFNEGKIEFTKMMPLIKYLVRIENTILNRKPEHFLAKIKIWR